MFRLYCWICVTWQSYPALLPSSHSDSYHSCQTSLCGEILPNRSRHHCGYVREHFPVPLSHPQTGKKKKVVVTKAQSRGVKPRSFVSMFTSCCWGFRLSLRTFYKKWQMAAWDRKRAVCHCCQRHWPDKPQPLELPQICKDKRRKLTGAVP